MSLSTGVIACCQKRFSEHHNDCSGFVRTVASDCGVLLFGDANEIVEQLQNSPISSAWDLIPDGATAAQYASRGYLVIGGAKAKGHGHVVVIVKGPLARGKYPYAFWGQYRGLNVAGTIYNVGFSRGHGTVNYAFGRDTRDQLEYAAIKPSTLLTPSAASAQGHIIYR